MRRGVEHESAQRSPRGFPTMSTHGVEVMLLVGGLLLAALKLLSALSAPPSKAPAPGEHPRSAELIALERALVAALPSWWRESDGLRSDGARYTVDVAQLASYSAIRGDQALYALFLPALREVIIDDPSSPYTSGMVAWRWRPGEPLDASGTTEALRTAEALWEGRRFGLNWRPEVAAIIRAYERHQLTDQGVWMIRNYYNLGVGAFSPNSYAVDYDPDFLFRLARSLEEEVPPRADAGAGVSVGAELHLRARALAKKSASLLEATLAPSGLTHQLIMPELSTLLPGLPLAFSSPNDIEALGNALTVAERCLIMCPSVARAAENFLAARPVLKRLYTATEGTPRGAEEAGVVELAATVRFACKRGADALATRHLSALLARAERFLARPRAARLYVASELLLTLTCLLPEPAALSLAE